MNIFQKSGATDVITAHIHCRRNVTVDGINIRFAPSTAFPQWKDRWPDGDPRLGFLRFEVDGLQMQSQFVPLSSVSHKKGYGPGGNPSRFERDYTVAWEKPPLEAL